MWDYEINRGTLMLSWDLAVFEIGRAFLAWIQKCTKKIKAVKKSAESYQTPLKFAKLPLRLLVGALEQGEFRPFRPIALRDADFFKADRKTNCTENPVR